jgi:ornithine lipid ester-linked acyl 2-hydroxylase
MRQLYQNLQTKSRRTLLSWGEKFLRNLEKQIVRYSLVGNTPFFDCTQFEWVAHLENNWSSIRQELDEILKYRKDLPNFQDISPDQSSITRDDRWKTYFFYAYGIKEQTNCDRCPETTRLIEQVPGMKTAFFSILYPHKHIPEHRGPYKGVLRYHLGLIVPQPSENCKIRVEREWAHWEEGKSLIFDDSFPHEVWNDTDGMRVVLFLDVVRPMRFPGSSLNELAIQLIARSPFVRDAHLNQKRWNERFERNQTLEKSDRKTGYQAPPF